MRASRLLAILLQLQLRGRVPATRLAREFEVAVRTIHRDVDALSAAGVPVHAVPGRHGGIVLDDSFRAELTGLTADEAAALPFAALGSTARALGLGEAAAGARWKLLASLPPAPGASAQRREQRFHFDPLPWYHPPDSPACLRPLADAVWRDRRIRVHYAGWRRTAVHVLDPLALVQKAGAWYLVAAAGRSPRTWRVASIQKLQVLDDAAARPRGFDLARYWARSSADFERRLRTLPATVRVSSAGREVLRATLPQLDAQVAATGRPVGRRGWLEARVQLEPEGRSARQLLQLGDGIEVLQPPSLRREMRRQLRRTLALYEPAPAPATMRARSPIAQP